MPSPKLPPRGCRDVLSQAARTRRYLTNLFARYASLYNFREVESPVLEPASLYASLGATSDVVAKETYTINNTDPELVLRPEATAGVARLLSNHLSTRTPPTRVWYTGPMFRRERPQAGRQRQFTQLGVEIAHHTSVKADPFHDVLVIELAARYLHAAGVQPKLRLNSLGAPNDRDRFCQALTTFLRPRVATLSQASQRRLMAGSPLRILDSPLEQDRMALIDAPNLEDFISNDQRAYAMRVQELLTQADVTFTVDKRLVRGLDYYTGTAFEFDISTDAKAVCAGGRYTNLVGDIAGVGFALGLERLENARGSSKMEKFDLQNVVAVIGLRADGVPVDAAVHRVARALRNAGVPVHETVEGGKIGRGVARAARNGALAVVVIGEREVLQGCVQVKIVREEAAKEEPVRVDESNVVQMVKKGIESVEYRKEITGGGSGYSSAMSDMDPLSGVLN